MVIVSAKTNKYTYVFLRNTNGSSSLVAQQVEGPVLSLPQLGSAWVGHGRSQKKKERKITNGKIMYILSPLLFHLVCRENGSMLSLKHFLILLYGYVGSH